MAYRNNAIHPNVAAARLGVSVDCVYERIRLGELAAEKDGVRWLVVLDSTIDDLDCDNQNDSRRDQSPSYGNQRSEPNEPFQVLSPRTLTRQLADQGEQIDQIRAQLESLQTHAQAGSISPAHHANTLLPGNDNHSAMEAADRYPRQHRGRLIMLIAIGLLILGGSAIQTSSAQRSDDLTVAFIFACGAVTGAVATWTTLNHRLASAVNDARHAVDHINPVVEGLSEPRATCDTSNVRGV